MKLVRVIPEGSVGNPVLVHDLVLEGVDTSKLRPIHGLLAFVSAHKSVTTSLTPARLSFVLDAKIQAAEYLHAVFKTECLRDQPLPTIEIPVVEPNSMAKVIALLEAYIGAIYSCLEVAAKLNASLHRDMPMTFRALSMTIGPFHRQTNPWIPKFFDVRSEIVHYNMAFVVASEGAMYIEFQGARKREHFAQGRQRIPLPEILTYFDDLKAMLDRWATEEIKSLDRGRHFVTYAPVDPTKEHIRKSKTVGQALAAIDA